MNSLSRNARQWLTVAAGLAMYASAGFASAQQAPAMAAPAFEALDRNADNRLSRTEAGYNRVLLQIFVTSDADGDGFVSRTEYSQATNSGLIISQNR